MQNITPSATQQMAVKVWGQRGPMRQWESRYMRSLTGLGAGDRLIPKAIQIVSVPSPGLWYRIKKGETWWGVSKTAYGKPEVKKGLKLINNSTWNDHIVRKKKGWEAYNVKGLQATPDYSASNPHAGHGSGNSYPVAWIPPLDGREPEQVYVPGTGPAGPSGSAGMPGTPGTSGPAGPMGPAGPGGARGPAGPMGPSGSAGARGPAGSMGPAGSASKEAILAQIQKYLDDNPDKVRGPAGPGGARGPAGPAGPGGTRGPAGPAGPMGPGGAAGAAGTGSGKNGNGMWVLPTLMTLVTLQ